MSLYSSTSASSNSATESPWRAFVRTLATLFLRAGVGFLLAVEHIVPELKPAWNFVWDKHPWTFVDTIANAGAPLPSIVAPAFVAVSLVALTSLVLGLITRLSAMLLAVLAVLSFPTAYALGYGENALLYLLIFGAIILLGPGIFSLDAIFTYRKPSKRKHSLV